MNESKVKQLTAFEIQELQKIYEPHIPYASNVNSLLLIYFKWKKSHPERDYLSFHVLGDDWRKSGTFLMKFRTFDIFTFTSTKLEFRTFDIFTFTLDKTGEDLYNLLRESKALKIEPKPRLTVIYGIRNEHLPPIYKSINDLEVPIKVTVKNKMYFLPKEEALKYSISCPDEVYIDKINLSHVDLICSLWPHAHAGAKEYLSTYIELNGGYGVYLKENNRLVSWVLQNHWGTLTVLETVPEFKRRGYGSLIIKKMCVEMGKEGINPLCTIVYGNNASESLFLKLGFRFIGDCTFLCL